MASLIGWLLLVGAILTLPLYVKAFYKHMFDESGDVLEKTLSIAFAFCSSWSWPLLIPGYWLWIHCFGKDNN